MSMLPLLLLGGVALVVMSKKKTTTSDEGFIPQIPPMPDRQDPEDTGGEPEDAPEEGVDEDVGPQIGDIVVKGLRRDRTGAHNWAIKLAESGYSALDYPIGVHGGADEIGFSETLDGAKKILADLYNEALVDAGYPEEAKNEPGRRLTAGVSSTLRAR